jgi:hypothetical protein
VWTIKEDTENVSGAHSKSKTGTIPSIWYREDLGVQKTVYKDTAPIKFIAISHQS